MKKSGHVTHLRANETSLKGMEVLYIYIYIYTYTYIYIHIGLPCSGTRGFQNSPLGFESGFE